MSFVYKNANISKTKTRRVPWRDVTSNWS